MKNDKYDSMIWDEMKTVFVAFVISGFVILFIRACGGFDAKDGGTYPAEQVRPLQPDTTAWNGKVTPIMERPE